MIKLNFSKCIIICNHRLPPLSVQNPFSKFTLAVTTLSVDRFSKFLQVLLGQTKTEILTSKHFVYRPPY